MRLTSLIILCFCMAIPASSAYGGNREMVEKEIKELDELNKQAVQQLPDIPQNGTIDLKAKVIQQDGKPKIDVIEHRVSPKKTKMAPLDKKKHLPATPVVDKPIDLGKQGNLNKVEGETTENEPNSD